ncbi:MULTISPECIES: hypothetical protein [Streptomyces]|uniref:hypothetical protein n=1 Tax=Streptomyces TaxID=1883 RepID=UPI00163C9A7D|nr:MULTISPECIES: hypothetical protein [Streptomyces]MBC2878275.1 hypothetical protein [Streptomyces sp. TYQ1024]UBI40606.1 hypothetical protein K7I03_31845 [Streptomyces mobaraensis]UKW33188.1 hypothetical protein MCU78_31770 [Streptomyces sp. TYQ1024]
MAQQTVPDAHPPAPPARRPRRALPVLLVSAAACSLLLTSCGTDPGPRDDHRRPGTAGDPTPGDDGAYEDEDGGAAGDEAYDDAEDDEAADPDGDGAEDEEEDDEEEETSESAYDDGFDTGQDVLEAGGKGSAVREVVWGGCEKRAHKAGTAYPDAWTRGCRAGVQTFRDR